MKKDPEWGTRIYLKPKCNDFDRAYWPDCIYPGVGRNTAIKRFCEQTFFWEWKSLYLKGWRATDWWR